ncbi:MAG: sigma 54-interacting transcriptional regulator [Acidobacteriota bacterium]
MKEIYQQNQETSQQNEETALSVDSIPVQLAEAELVDQINQDLAQGLIDAAIAKQRRLPVPATKEQVRDFARLRALIAERLATLGRAAGIFDVLQPYDTALSRVRLPVEERARISLRLGEAYCNTVNYPSSVALLDEAIRYASMANDRRLEATARCQLGRVYCQLGEYVIAQEHLRNALKFLAKADDKRGEAQAYLYFGLVSSGLGNFDSSIEYYYKCIALAEKISDESMLIECKVNLGTAFLSQGKLRQAISLYEIAVHDYEQLAYSTLAAQVYNNLAHSLILSGGWKRAEQLLEKSIALSRQHQDDYGEAMALGQFGLLYMVTGRIPTAKQTLNFSIELARQSHSRDCEGFSQIMLGKAFLAGGEFAQAIPYLQAGYELALTINRTIYAIEAQLLLAEVSLGQQNWEQVEEGLKRAEKLMAGQPHIVLEGKRLHIEARLAVAREQDALPTLTRAIQIFEAYSYPLEKALCLLDRAKILSATRETFAKASADIERAMRLLEQLGAEPLLVAAAAQLKELERKLTKSSNASEVELVRQQLLAERQQLHRLIKACRSRELMLTEVAESLRSQSQADIVAIYQIEHEVGIKTLATTTDLAILKNAFERRVQTAVTESKRAWIRGRSLDEPLYLDLYPLSAEKQLAVVIWGAPRKLVNTELIHSLVEIAGELITLAALPEGRRVTTDESESGRLKSFQNLSELVYASRKMGELTEQILRIHSSDLTVLITGESGTGKDLIARAIHAVSERRSRPFLPFNCTATPREIVEAQLFGYRKGAFTGANIDYEGVIRAVDGGTLLLDEIGDLHLSVQPKLLRFLQDGEIQPIGYSRPIRVDVRVIASTNRNLETMVERGEFREDLYHRLNIIRLAVPSLRQRREEIQPLAQFFLKLSCQRTNKQLSFSSEALLLLGLYDWPGNVRQLKNEIERVVAFANQGETIEKYHLSPEILQATANLKMSEPLLENGNDISLKPGLTLTEILAATEKQIILKAVKQCRGNLRRTAVLLGISRKGLYDKLKRLKIRLANTSAPTSSR